MNLSDAAEWADVVMILTPDELQAEIYKNHIEQRVKRRNKYCICSWIKCSLQFNKSQKRFRCISWLLQKDLVT